MYDNFFIHLSVDGHLGCFHVLAIVKSAATNIGVYVSFSILVSSGYISRSGIAGSWNSSTLATWCEEPTHLKRPWCWERLKAGGEGDNRGWDGWMVTLTQWTWVWVNSGSWWWTGRPGVLRLMGSQSWTWLSDWTELNLTFISFHSSWSFLHYRLVGSLGFLSLYSSRLPHF